MTHLFVEHTIPLIDVGNVALIFVEPLSGEFALLVNATA
jgi:hypothetical protein